MADFNKILVNTLGYEGGQTVDTGGYTNMGIRQDLYDAYTTANKLPKESVKDLKYGKVKSFYQSEYYDKPKINLLPEETQSIMFDASVNLGQGTAIKQLQNVIGTKADGKIGKKTLEALNGYVEKNGVNKLNEELIYARGTHYQTLNSSNPEKYGQYAAGWMNRLRDLAVKNGIEI